MNEESLFAAVLEKPTHGERQALLQTACRSDADLLRRMNRLLASHEQASGILDHSRFVNETTAKPVSEQYGTIIGPYVLRDLLGEGGFGQVFVAEQCHPVRREVAIKLIKPGMNSREVLARFEGERQALALMNHDNIARVYDAGTTNEGRSYFVMELVRGVPIAEYADTQQLNTRERLRLFCSVCLAVHHAHQKGILHRDLKPSNVLVTTQDEQPVIKVIDFGVAKALHQPFMDDPFETLAHQLIGTPAYMSPEQAGMNGQDVDTRTDIYSLGVLLYELLVGATPFDRERLRSASYDEMRRIIREEEPLCPSTRMSTLGMLATTVSSNRRASPRQLSQLFRGELDWIVMKAMEKDRERRYSSASDLARDVNRFLKHEPVEASPASSIYRISKFLQRHRRAAFAAATMLVLLIAGVVGTSIGMFHAWEAQKSEAERAEGEARERHRAVQAEADALAKAKLAALEAETSTSLVEFLRNDLLSQAGIDMQIKEHIPPNPQLTVHEALDRAAARLNKSKTGRPEIEGRIRFTIGTSYLELGLYAQAEAQLRLAVNLLEQHLGQKHTDTLEALNALGRAYRHHGNVQEAIAIHEKLRDLQLSQQEADHPGVLRTLNNLAMDYRDARRYKEALTLLEQVYTARVKANGPRHPATLTTLQNLALLNLDLNQHDEALTLHKQVQLELQAIHGPDHPETLISLNNLATTYWKLNQLKKSVPLFEQLLPQYEKIIGKTHLETYRLKANLGINYRDQGRLNEAIALLEQAYEGSKKYASLRRFTSHELVNTYLQAGDREKAKAVVAQSMAAARQAYRPQSKSLAVDITNYSAKLVELQSWSEAELLLRESLAIWQRPPAETGNLYIAKSLLGEALLGQAQKPPSKSDQGKLLAEAESLLLECHASFTEREKTLSEPSKKRFARTIDLLIQLNELTNKSIEVKKWQAEKEKRITLSRQG